MSIIKIAVLFSISLIFGGIENVCSCRNFRSNQLEDISKHIDIDWPDRDSTIIVKYGKRDVVVRVSHDYVEHIGYRIFPCHYRDKIVNSQIADFVERYWLWLTLPLERQKTIGQQMVEDKFLFHNGNIATVDIIQNDSITPFSCSVTPELVEMSWGNQDNPICKISFPVNHELILGRCMLENDRRLPEEINSVIIDEITNRYATTLCADSTSSIWVEKSGNYLNTTLKSERYYTSSSDGMAIKPVFSINRCIESIMNLFTGCDIDKAENIRLTITHKIFGFNEQTIETTIPKFVAYSLNNNCKPYVGVISIDEKDSGVADILVIMHNSTIGYNHVLRVSLPLLCISSGEGIAAARLNAFVPSSNVKNLFKNEI